MQNKLSDLNNHLFAQLERLDDEDISGDALREEIDRAKAMAVIAEQVIDNASLILKAVVFKANELPMSSKMPELLEG